MPKAKEVATGVAMRCLDFVSRVHVHRYLQFIAKT
jgi:hypothetical protein